MRKRVTEPSSPDFSADPNALVEQIDTRYWSTPADSHALLSQLACYILPRRHCLARRQSAEATGKQVNSSSISAKMSAYGKLAAPVRSSQEPLSPRVYALLQRVRDNPSKPRAAVLCIPFDHDGSSALPKAAQELLRGIFNSYVGSETESDGSSNEQALSALALIAVSFLAGLTLPPRPCQQ